MKKHRTSDNVVAERAIELVRDFSVAVDGGAHRGGWTQILRARFATVHAVEPCRELYSRLRDRFAGSNVTVIQAALSDYDGSGELRYPRDPPKWRGGYIGGAGDIPITRLDALGLTACGLVKLDIEGAELLALRGAADTISRCSPVLVVEFKDKTAARFGWSRSDLFDWMAARSYRLAFEVAPNLIFARA
jgi:FkbM family methyltransferase